MRRPLAALAAFLALAVLGGCPKKWQNGECETSENCKDQTGFGKVCVQGRCQECGQDGDCQAGFVCKANKCQPRPECESAADCKAGRTCEAGACVAIPGACAPDLPCPAGNDCVDGRCVATPPPAPAPGPCDDLGSVYFDFDKSEVKTDGRETLQKTARCITDEHISALRVEGNCDERGTAEYNMHLGQRRADAVKKYLGGLGVPVQEVKTISYGKERPVCTEHDEACWQKNRRADVKR